MLDSMVAIANINNEPENLHAVMYEGVAINSIYSQAFLFGDDMGRFRRILGICNYCGNKAFYRFKNGNLCCEEYNAKCPIIREKNKKKNSGKTHPNYGKDKYFKEKAKEAPLCRCGCNEKVTWNKGQRRWNEFIKGHQNKGRDKWAKEKAKLSPICKCGCGKRTKWCSIRKQWNKFIDGHNRIRQIHTEEAKEKMSKRMKNGGSAYMRSFIKNSSKPQVELFELIKGLYPTAILEYFSLNRSIDIAIPDKMIAIEYDGSYWHKGHEAEDAKRQKLLESTGWKFIRYTDYVPTIDELKRDLYDKI